LELENMLIYYRT